MYILVLNLGLKSIRSIIFDPEGNKIISYHLPINTFLKGDFVEQEPAEWWEKGKTVINTTIDDREIRSKIKYITVVSSAACLIPTDENGNPLYRAIMVSDKRAVEQAKYLGKLPAFQKLYQKVGLPPAPYFMIPKIIWLKEREPDVFSKARKYLSPNDFLIAKMTGEFVTDSFNAEKYYYNHGSGQGYDAELLDELGIPIGTLPEVVDPGTRVLPLKQEVIEEFDFPPNVELVVSSYDAICAFFGSGVAREGEASDVSGTVTSFRVLTRNNVKDGLDRIFTQAFIGKNFYIVGGSNNLGGGLIEWAKQCYYSEEKYSYEVMEKEAKESAFGAKGLIFLPYLLGERTPLWNPDARGVFFGLERNHTRGDMVRAIFESTGFCIKNILNVIEEQGIDVKNIRVSGGLTRIPYISQLKADITGKEIWVVDEFETTSLGALLLVGLGVGLYSNLKEAAEKIVNIRDIILPNKRNFEKYQEVYRLFEITYQALVPVFRERQKLVSSIYREDTEKIENL